MANEIIDLTSPSPPRTRPNNSSRNNHFHPYVSTRGFEFRRTTRFLSRSPNTCYICHHMFPWMPLQPSRQINGPRQNIRGVSGRSNHSNHNVSMYQPIAQSNVAHLFPQGATLDKSWTFGEHELFVMGLKNYGRNKWDKIASNFVLSKTPQEVKKYEEKFFNLLPTTNSYGFNPSYNNMINGVEMGRRNKNHMGASSSSSPNPMIMPINEQPPPTFASFPTRGASTSIVANDEVDLELRLG